MRAALSFAIALLVGSGACGYNDTPIATYLAPLPDASAGVAGVGSAGAPVAGSASSTAGATAAGAGGEAGAPVAEPACLQTYPITLEGLTSRYKEVTVGQPWVVAARDCESEGGHLVVIDDQLENDWLKGFAERSVTDSASTNQLSWLGLGDHAIEGEFRWVTGAPLDLALWAEMEPNSLRGIEDCVEIRAEGTWNDDRCNANLSYVCECDGAAVAPQAWCDTDTTATCGDCNTSCESDQTCSSQTCM